jgi:hypothetical protein
MIALVALQGPWRDIEDVLYIDLGGSSVKVPI